MNFCFDRFFNLNYHFVYWKRFSISVSSGMIVKDSKEKSSADKTFNIWLCKECGFYHIKTGETLLTLDNQEFAEFVEKACLCLYENEVGTMILQ